MFNGNFMTKLRQSNAGHAVFKGVQAQNQYNLVPIISGDRAEGSSAMGSSTAASGVGNNRIGTTSGVGNQNSINTNQAHLFNLVNQRKTPTGS